MPAPRHPPRAAAEAGCPCGLLSQRAAASLSPSLGSGVLPEGPRSKHRHGAGASGEQEDRSPGLPSGPRRGVSARPTNPGLTRWGNFIHVSAFVIHIWVRVKYGPVVSAGGDVNCVPLMPDEGESGGVDEGAAAREVAAVWGKASRARWREGPGIVKGGEPGILCVSGPSVFWAC